jgi:hypothetical protein
VKVGISEAAGVLTLVREALLCRTSTSPAGLPQGFQIWRLSCNDPEGTGKIKLPAKESDTNRAARDRARSRCKICDPAARAMRRIA